MKFVILPRSKLEKLKPLSKNSYGCLSECCSYKDGVIKSFYEEIDKATLMRIKKNLKRNSKIVIYPKKLVYKLKYEKYKLSISLVGYYMKKAPGINLTKLLKNIIIGSMDLSYERLLYLYYEKFLPELREEEVAIYDMKASHVFIDDNIYLTDTDDFDDELYVDDTDILSKLYKEPEVEYLEDNSFDRIYKYNLGEINKCFEYILYFISNYSLNIDYNLEDENYLKAVISQIKEQTSADVKTLGQLNKYKR